MFVAGVNPQAPFDTGDYRQLIRLEEAEGRVVTTPTLGEVLQRNGRRLVTLSSGTTGNGFLLNPQARHGVGRRDSRPLRSRQDGRLPSARSATS